LLIACSQKSKGHARTIDTAFHFKMQIVRAIRENKKKDNVKDSFLKVEKYFHFTYQCYLNVSQEAKKG
jgi:hypothetical protein